MRTVRPIIKCVLQQYCVKRWQKPKACVRDIWQRYKGNSALAVNGTEGVVSPCAAESAGNVEKYTAL